jgi:hypothetical protein
MNNLMNPIWQGYCKFGCCCSLVLCFGGSRCWLNLFLTSSQNFDWPILSYQGSVTLAQGIPDSILVVCKPGKNNFGPILNALRAQHFPAWYILEPVADGLLDSEP